MTAPDLAGRTILVVEYDFFIAADTADQVRAAGGKVLDPAPSVRRALLLLDDEVIPDGAILDIMLADAEVY